MSTYVIVGGHGKIGLLLAARLAGEGDVVHSTIRSDDHRADVEETGAVPVTLDIEAADVDAYSAIFAGADAVIFAAGAGGDGRAERKLSVDLGGSIKSIAAAKASGIRRFVQVSAMGVDEPLDDGTDDVWRAYVEAKRDADIALRSSGLDYTIVRPGRLVDKPGTGHVQVGERVPRGDVPRADVAAVIANALAENASIGAQFELITGSVPIPEAVAGLR